MAVTNLYFILVYFLDKFFLIFVTIFFNVTLKFKVLLLILNILNKCLSLLI